MSFTWPELLPEMRAEVRARCLESARCLLALTCRAEYEYAAYPPDGKRLIRTLRDEGPVSEALLHALIAAALRAPVPSTLTALWETAVLDPDHLCALEVPVSALLHLVELDSAIMATQQGKQWRLTLLPKLQEMRVRVRLGGSLCALLDRAYPRDMWSRFLRPRRGIKRRAPWSDPPF